MVQTHLSYPVRGDVGAIGAEAPAPILDEDGLLRANGRWVAISDAQLPILRLLLDHPDRVVRFDDITAAYVAAGSSGHPASVRTVLSRLGGRLRSVGLDLVSVRRRGVVLRVPSSDG